MTKIRNFILLVLGSVITMTSCSIDQNDSQKKIVTDYIQGLNKEDFSLILKCVSDSVVTAEMNYVLTKNKQELYKHFQWDSVFQPKYNLIGYKTDSAGLICTIGKTGKRIEFLQDTSMVYKTRFEFKGNKIIKISLIDYVYLDTLGWQSRRDSLVAWIDKYHPELSGFVYDLTPGGAQKYLTAIDLYKKEK